MKSTLRFLTYISALLGISMFLRPVDNTYKILLWVPKLFGAALSPLMRVTGIFGTFLGILRGDWKLATAGIISTGLSARYINDLPDSDEQFEKAFGPAQAQELPRRFNSLEQKEYLQSTPTKVDFDKDVICGQSPISGAPLLGDLWQPTKGQPRSGLAVVYAHGSGWRVGDKDMLTRHFFQQVVADGHVVLDLAYTLWPGCDIPTMVAEFNQAIFWLKENSANLHINPDRVIAMGGSAGGHLALLAAYGGDQPEFKPSPADGDTSVRAVVAFYPPVDLLDLYSQSKAQVKTQPSRIDQIAQGLINRIFILKPGTKRGAEPDQQGMTDFFVQMLGGNPEQVPETYQLLSPIQHIGPHCPPTLLLQGGDDLFDLAPGVRRLHEELQSAGAVSILVEYPHTDHGFDLVLPGVSPVARSATREVARFLSAMV